MANYVPANVYNNPIVGMVDDGDAVNAAESNPRIEDVADNAEYCYQRVNAQHVSGGNHFEVVCTGDVNDVKLNVEANAGDAGTVKTQTWEGAAGTVLAAMLANGTLLQSGQNIYGSNDFDALAPADVAVFERANTCDGCYVNVNDGTWYYAVTRRLELPPGTQITFEISGNRPTNEGQSLIVTLCYCTMAVGSLTLVSAVTLGAGTGEITTAGGGPHTLVTGRDYFFRAAFNNNTPGTLPADAIILRGVQLDFGIP